MPRKAVILAFAAVAALWTFQLLTVHFNYGGNWTGLFCTSSQMPVPKFLKSEPIYIFQNSDGYDGQIYHLIAHDPWMRRGSRDAIAGAAFRYQRIFVPAMAWLLALGQDGWVHAAYFTVILAFVFIGVYWTARFAERAGRPSEWGLIFALTPAALTSIDRMTADVALAAFTAGFALYCGKTVNWRVLAILTCAVLSRETALAIVAGYGAYLLIRRQWTGALLTAATVIPAMAWRAYVSHGEASELPGYVNWIPLAGFFNRIVVPFPYPFSPVKIAIAEGFDFIALAGVGLALALVLRMAARREWSAIAASVYACTVTVIFLKSRAVWEDVYAFGRVLTPFLLLTMLHDLMATPWLAVLPIALIDARLGLNFGEQVKGIVRGIAGI